jgi:hypothetical protein
MREINSYFAALAANFETITHQALTQKPFYGR